jgi:hypothetical protein
MVGWGEGHIDKSIASIVLLDKITALKFTRTGFAALEKDLKDGKKHYNSNYITLNMQR